MYQNQLYLYWNIGKHAYENKDKCINSIEKYSNYYSYRFGNSYLFTRNRIRMMILFYLTFPIFFKQMENITWNQYMLLLNIEDKKERYFYFYLSLFFHSDYQQTKDFIFNDYYFRI
ncbi:MAG: hypothetical protein IKE70_05890 [Bacilli bacterium]|nr:hypothetical protein [Bacilli bacterium]